MRNRLITCCLLIAAALLVVGSVGVPSISRAQDMEKVVCDSTLITLLYIAEHDYGFKPMVDVSTFEKGQFAPLFEAMMASMEAGMMEATPDTMMGESGMMEATPDSMMGMEGMMALTPGVVEGENPACTALRAELEAFLYTHFTGMMSSN